MEYTYQPADGDLERVSDIKNRLHTEARLRDLFPKVEEKHIERLEDLIAITAVEVTSLLGLEKEDIVIRPGILEPDVQATLRIMTASDGSDYKKELILNPNGMAYYLGVASGENKRIAGVLEMLEDDFRGSIAHEYFHLHQLRKFPLSAGKTMNVMARKGPQAYEKDWGEVGARLFAFNYISSRKTSGWRESLGQKLHMLQELPRVKSATMLMSGVK